MSPRDSAGGPAARQRRTVAARATASLPLPRALSLLLLLAAAGAAAASSGGRGLRQAGNTAAGQATWTACGGRNGPGGADASGRACPAGHACKRVNE